MPRRLRPAVLSTALLALSASAQPTGPLQIIHNAADPALSVVDVFVGADRVADDLTFRSATGGLAVPTGVALSVEVRDAAGGAVLATGSVTLPPGEPPRRLVVQGVSDPAAFAPNPDGRPTGVALVDYPAPDPAAPGRISLLVVNGLTDAPAVDIGQLGIVFVGSIAYGDGAPLQAFPDPTLVDVTATAGSALLAQFETDLGPYVGERVTMLLSGFLDPAANSGGPDFAVVGVRESGETFLAPRFVAADGRPGDPAVTLDVMPNPSAGAVRVTVEGGPGAPADLAVYDVLGRRVARLAAGPSGAGRREVHLDGLAAGVYVVRLRAGADAYAQTFTVGR